VPRKIAVLTDAHANLPALEAALAAIRAEGCEAVYHTGDAIGIGPYPAECLDRLLHTPTTRLVMGNHDAWFAFGLPRPRPPWMSEGEVAHQRWVHAQLDPALRSAVACWPYVVREAFGRLRVTFAHYGLDEAGRCCSPFVPDPAPADVDRLFARFAPTAVLFYGHDHAPADNAGRARYVNPGALGCGPQPLARFAVLAVAANGSYEIAKHAVPYDDADLFRQFEERDVPERAFICETFYGRGAGGRSPGPPP
jgi:predicted phosphodiesterase